MEGDIEFTKATNASYHSGRCQQKVCNRMCNNGTPNVAATQHKQAKARPCYGACDKIRMHVPKC